MKVSPVSSPHAIQPTGTSSPQSGRAKAIAAFNNPPIQPESTRPQGEAPLNQNAVSVEDLSSIQAVPEEQQLVAEIPEEAAVEETPKEDPALSRQFAQLARQERALRAQKQQFQAEMKTKEAELQAKVAALEGKASPQQDLSNYISIDDLKRDTYGTLQRRAGISYDEITRQAMEYQPVNPQVQAMLDAQQAKIDQLLALNETSQKSQTDSQAAQYQSALKQIETDVTRLVQSDPNAYEAIAKTGKGSIKEVVKLIEEVYNKDGYIMDVEEAANEVENYLVEQSIKTVSRIDKIRKQLATSTATTKPVGAKPQAPQQQPQMKTLTNASSATRKLSQRERAMLAFKGELK